MFRIGEFSKFAKVSTRMLRYYDEVGLFKPLKIDAFTGYRYYCASQIPEIIKIITLRDVGFNISEISRLIEIEDDEAIIRELKRKQFQIEESINHERRIISDINNLISSLRKEIVTMDYKVKLKEIPSYKAVSLRSVVENYSKEGDLWASLGEFALQNQLHPVAAPFAIYHDGEHKESNVDIEVLMPVEKLQESQGKFVFREVERVSCMATLLYKGRYEKIDKTFFYLAKWIEDSKYETFGKARQMSIKGEWNESNPDNYLIEIQMPVKK